MSTRIAVVGTGTGVGKTHTTTALLAALVSRGERASGLKPVESGVGSGETDAGLLAAASSVQPFASPYTFPDPVSPHLAARRTGQVISLTTIREWIDRHEADWLMIETAGGLLSPLAVGVSNLDMVRAIEPAMICLVALDRLGVLHEASACMLAIRTLLPASIPTACLLQSTGADASSGTNASELKTLGILENIVTFPRADARDPSSQKAAADALALVTRLLSFT